MNVGNTNIMYVRLYGGQLIPLNKVNFVQVDPNNGNIVQEIPLNEPINKLMWHNMHDYNKPLEDWHDLNKVEE